MQSRLYNEVKQISLGQQENVIAACPISSTFLLPVQIVQPLCTALLLGARADMLCNLGPRQSTGDTLT